MLCYLFHFVQFLNEEHAQLLIIFVKIEFLNHQGLFVYLSFCFVVYLDHLIHTQVKLNPFWRLSVNDLPILIVSPTDFIEVVKLESAPLNFSKVNLGIFVTT